VSAGVDTVKLSYPIGTGRLWTQRLSSIVDANGKRGYAIGDFWSGVHEAGATGPLRYRIWHHPDLRSPIVCKGVRGASCVLLYEGSVPKALGMCGVAEFSSVGVLDGYIRKLLREEAGLYGVPAGRLRRLDLTCDVFDPAGVVRDAAREFNPHKRSRYWEDVIQQGETVWQHNKSRGFRVYAKYLEACEELRKAHGKDASLASAEWARDLTRIEYQIGAAWCDKYGFTTRNLDDVAAPVLDELVFGILERVPAEKREWDSERFDLECTDRVA